MKRCVGVFITIAGLSVALLAQLQAQGNVGQIQVGGSPVVPDNLVTSQPVPRLPDGKVDLTGPWVGGGSQRQYRARRRIESRASFRCCRGRRSS